MVADLMEMDQRVKDLTVADLTVADLTVADLMLTDLRVTDLGETDLLATDFAVMVYHPHKPCCAFLVSFLAVTYPVANKLVVMDLEVFLVSFLVVMGAGTDLVVADLKVIDLEVTDLAVKDLIMIDLAVTDLAVMTDPQNHRWVALVFSAFDLTVSDLLVCAF